MLSNGSMPTMGQQLKALLQESSPQLFKTGQTIIEEGVIDPALYVLLQGQARALGLNDAGRELILNTFGAGDVFGEMALDGGPRSARVVAQQDCECVRIPNARVHQHIRDHPEFGLQLLLLVIARARKATEKAKDMALSDVYARLSKTLTHLADEANTIAPKITHNTLAQMVGSSREMVSKLMKDLEKGGYVQGATDRLVLCKRLPQKW